MVLTNRFLTSIPKGYFRADFDIEACVKQYNAENYGCGMLHLGTDLKDIRIIGLTESYNCAFRVTNLEVSVGTSGEYIFYGDIVLNKNNSLVCGYFEKGYEWGKIMHRLQAPLIFKLIMNKSIRYDQFIINRFDLTYDDVLII